MGEEIIDFSPNGYDYSVYIVAKKKRFLIIWLVGK